MNRLFNRAPRRRKPMSVFDAAWLVVLNAFAGTAIDNRRNLNPGESPW